MISRRGILSGLIVAPSIVVINNIMPVKAFVIDPTITNQSVLYLMDLIKEEIAEACRHNLFDVSESAVRDIENRMLNLRSRNPDLTNFYVHSSNDKNSSKFGVYFHERGINNTKRISVSINKCSMNFKDFCYEHTLEV